MACTTSPSPSSIASPPPPFLYHFFSTLIVAMQDLVREVYSDTPSSANLRAAEVARAYHLHCCNTAYQWNYLFYLEEDVTLAVANAAAPGVG